MIQVRSGKITLSYDNDTIGGLHDDDTTDTIPTVELICSVRCTVYGVRMCSV